MKGRPARRVRVAEWWLASVLLMFGAERAGAQPVFTATFESDLSGWGILDIPEASTAVIRTDPLEAANHALTFAPPLVVEAPVSGSAIGPAFPVQPGVPYLLRFRYLRLPPSDPNLYTAGGYVGFEADPGHPFLTDFCLLAKSPLVNILNAPIALIDDGRWHEYEVLFDPYANSQSSCTAGHAARIQQANAIRILLAVGQGPDAYFDDVTVTPATETGGFRAKLVYPRQAGNAGSVKLTIAGENFLGTPEVFLMRDAMSLGASLVQVSGPQALVAHVDLSGAAPGDWQTLVVNGDGRMTLTQDTLKVVEFKVDGVVPRSVGTGITSLTIVGTSLTPDTVLETKLTRNGISVLATGSTAGPYGDFMMASFDLRGAPEGVYDLVVVSRGGVSATLAGGVTVGNPRAELWTDVLGPEAIEAALARQSSGVPIRIAYGNSGNLDAEMVVLLLEVSSSSSVPANVDANLQVTPIRPVPRLSGQDDSLYNAVQTLRARFEPPIGNLVYLPFLIPRIPAGATAELTVPVQAGGERLHVRASLLGPSMRQWLYDTSESNSCTPALASIIGCTAPFPAILDGLSTLNVYDGDTQAAATSSWYLSSGLTPVVGRQLWAQLALGCRALGTSVSDIVGPLAQLGPELFYSATCASTRTIQATAIRSFQLVAATDPNDKSGPSGVTERRAILPDTALPYTIRFENLATATAPAKDVIITDQLDPQTMDLSTFSLGSIAFGDLTIPVPWGRQTFETQIDLRPRLNLFLHASASLDPGNGRIVWEMHARDPLTGLRPSDPLQGFLPPNVNPPEGDGHVTFTVMPRGSLANGTAVRNSASIVFDFNAAITTPEWTNTVDSTPPVLSASASPAPDSSGWNNTTVNVDFSCSDALSGVAVEPVDVVLAAEGTNQTASASCLDGLGHSASATVAGIRIDKTAPAVAIGQPSDGATFVLNQSTAASYTCTDARSGVASCAGPVVSGASLDTTTVGSRTFTVAAMDVAGNAASVTHRYTVGYSFEGFLSPLNNVPVTNRGPAGRTYPVKWILRDANGAFVGDPAAINEVAVVPASCGVSATDVTGEVTTMDVSGLRYDALTGEWHFNWRTLKSQIGCWTLEVRLADGRVHAIAFELR